MLPFKLNNNLKKYINLSRLPALAFWKIQHDLLNTDDRLPKKTNFFRGDKIWIYGHVLKYYSPEGINIFIKNILTGKQRCKCTPVRLSTTIISEAKYLKLWTQNETQCISVPCPYIAKDNMRWTRGQTLCVRRNIRISITNVKIYSNKQMCRYWMHF